MKKLPAILSALTVVIFLFLSLYSANQNQDKKSSDTYLVTDVIDGDTIEIEGGQKIRYIGVDTPETTDPRKEVQCFGKEAASANEKLVLGKHIKLETDVNNTDRYGRLLRYVYLVDGENEIFVNDYLVKNGFAFAKSYPPDVRFQDLFRLSEQQASADNLGLWGSCSL